MNKQQATPKKVATKETYQDVEKEALSESLWEHLGKKCLELHRQYPNDFDFGQAMRNLINT